MVVQGCRPILRRIGLVLRALVVLPKVGARILCDMMSTSHTIGLTPEVKESRVYQEERLQGYLSNVFKVYRGFLQERTTS